MHQSATLDVRLLPWA